MIRNNKGQFTSNPCPERKTGKYINCQVCGKIKYFIATKIKAGQGKFCSQKCYWKWMKGKPSSIKGKKISEEGRRNISEGGKGKHNNEKNSQWKGDDVGYGALHHWVKRHLGKAANCLMRDNNCKGRFEWANKSQE